MTKKKKKGHGGLKFLVFLVIVATLITTIKIGVGTEVGQRIVGQREDRRVERTSLTPRFAFAAATLQVTVGTIYSTHDGTAVDLTTTKHISIDRQSATATREINIAPTPSQVSPGVDAVPMDDVSDSYTDILTKDYRYESAIDAGQPWTRFKNDPYYYGTELDSHYIPMIDDIMGFELRELPSKPAADEAKSGFNALTRQAVDGRAVSSSVTRSYSYEMDMNTFRRAIPILANRTGISVDPTTQVAVTIGFDDVGLLRYADVKISSATASTTAQALGPKRRVVYRYTMNVTDISGEPIKIDIPTDFVDARDDTAPINGAPVDTTPVATP